MQGALRYLTVAAVAAAVIGPPAARADGDRGNHMKGGYVMTNLVSDLAGTAQFTDPNLKNAWGVAFSPSGSPFWVNDNATGLSSLYNGDGSAGPFTVTIPGHNGAPSAPTGIVWNGNAAFKVPNTSVTAAFIFDTEDGTISAWGGGLTPPDQAVLAVDNSASAVYKGLAFGVNVHGSFIFATNFRAGTVDVFDSNFKPATLDGAFQDPNIPAGYAPFGIQNIGGDLFVTYAKQDAQKHDDVAGQGHGFVDVFDTDGNLLRQFAQRGKLNSPWGVARASLAFGEFSGDILIGNFGDGRINAFDSDGHFAGQLNAANGRPLTIDGLWTLTQGGGVKSSPDTIYFTAGPNDETDGLFGTITPSGHTHGGD